jgi:hypothetical protein
MSESSTSNPALLAAPVTTTTPSLLAPTPSTIPATSLLSASPTAVASNLQPQPCASSPVASPPAVGHPSSICPCTAAGAPCFPTIGCSTSVSPVNSEKLDWGSIGAIDGAYGLRCSLLAEATCVPASPKLGDGTNGAIAALIPPQVTTQAGAQKQEQLTSRKLFSLIWPPSATGRQPNTLTKLKSVLIVLDRLKGHELLERIHGGLQHDGQDLSQEWSLVKSKCGARSSKQASFGGALTQGTHRVSATSGSRQLPPDYKKMFKGKCF